MLAVTEEPMEAARRFDEETGWGVPIAVDGHARLRAAYGVRAYPTVVVVGRDGRVARRGEGVTAETLGSWVGELLGE